MMQRLFSLLVVVFSAAVLLAIAADKTPPKEIVFKATMGKVTFLHAKHIERAKNDCKVCHDKLFQQSATAPLNFKANMHKTAEASKTSCAGCHVAGGTAFVTTGNCTKCHVKG
jgi:c(7)-type cytochrome triheme protein